jgi:hypothetical protein
MPKGTIKDKAFTQYSADSDDYAFLDVPQIKATGVINCYYNDDDPSCPKGNMRYVSFDDVTVGDDYNLIHVPVLGKHLAAVTTHV